MSLNTQPQALTITHLASIAVLASLAGCSGPSVWQEGFNPETPAVVIAAPTTSQGPASLLATVRTREIP
jgi:hypothetical protein